MMQMQNAQQANLGSRPQTTAGTINGVNTRQNKQNLQMQLQFKQENGQTQQNGRIFTQANSNNVYVSQSHQPQLSRGQIDPQTTTISPNIKEIMNTSAPIRISNFINNNEPPSRPTQSRGQARRQTTGNVSGVRKTAASYMTNNNNQLGIISGQTIRAQTREEGLRVIAAGNAKFTVEQVAVNSIGTIGSFDTSSQIGQQISQNMRSNAQQQLKYNQEDGYLRGARIAEKIQEFYHSAPVTNQNVVIQGMVKNQGQGYLPNHNMIQPNRGDQQSQGGIRQLNTNKSGIVVTDADQKRAASAYGGTVQTGQRRNLVVYKQQSGVQTGQTQPNGQAISSDSRLQQNNQQVNNFFSYTGSNVHSSNNYANDNGRIPQKSSNYYTQQPNPSSLGSHNYTERDVQTHMQRASNQRSDNQEVQKMINDKKESQITQGIVQNYQTADANRVDQTGMTSTDIRQIKLNYLQLNKRQTQPPQTAQPGAKRGQQIVGVQKEDDRHNQEEERHPLDKAQIYKMEGAPAPEELEFCTEGSTIDNLDHYIIGKRIGQGAYAVVRLGLHKILNQKIAVKIYEKIKLLEPNRRKSVKREMKIMEKLDHPNIAKLYEVFESQKQVFLIMEYVNGGSLHGYLKMKPNRQMTELEAKFLWTQVVQAIYYCHQRNVTHRDVKLENILLDETKTVVKMIDFGFSTCIPHERKVKIFCGTPSYMAPEIVSKIEYSGPPADIWALGVLLFALLCGKFPFKGQNDKELYSHICTKELQCPDHVSPGARKFLNKIFQKDPDKRPTAKDILKDPWVDISNQELEMLSPRHALGFANNTDIINYERVSQSMNQTQKVGGVIIKPNTAAQGTRQKLNQDSNMVIAPQNIQFVNATGSKDKRLTMLPDKIKKFIIDSNQNRLLSPNQFQQNNQSAMAQVASQPQIQSQLPHPRNDINMEAYNAYYNNHDQKDASQKSDKNTNIINNIMHINSAGANINITTAPNCQNNFIFNHTAPLNFNFYNENQGQESSQQPVVNVQEDK